MTRTYPKVLYGDFELGPSYVDVGSARTSGPNRRFFGDRCRQPASYHGLVPLLGCEGFGELLDQLVLPKLLGKLDQQLP